MLNYLRKVLRQSHYVINKNHHFEINLYGLVIYNCFISNLLRSSENSFNLTELLFMKAYICKSRNDNDAYNYFYNIARHYGMFLYSKQELDKIERDIL